MIPTIFSSPRTMASEVQEVESLDSIIIFQLIPRNYSFDMPFDMPFDMAFIMTDRLKRIAMNIRGSHIARISLRCIHDLQRFKKVCLNTYRGKLQTPRRQLQQIQLWRIRPGLILSLLFQMVGQVCRVQQYGFVFDQNPVRATLEQYLGILQQQLPR